jgi:transcriptional regulator with XRE-family HTH domain
MDDTKEGNSMKTIRALRQARGWTQYELALQVGVHPQAVYLWESGRRTPHVPQLRKLGQLFGLCSDEIDLELPPADRSPGEPAHGRLTGSRSITRGTEDDSGAP